MEREIIELAEKIRKDSAPEGVVLSMGDDCAVLAPSAGMEIAVTTDTLEEGIHFSHDYFSPCSLGIKTAAVNLSDMAAMGAVPRWAFLNLSLDRNHMNLKWTSGFMRGLSSMLAAHGTHLAGGDTVAAAFGLSVTMTIIGEVEPGMALSRGGASPGDTVFCSGFTGEAGGGLVMLRHPETGAGMGRIAARRLRDRHLHPVPQVAAGRTLAENCLASSATDISDGIATDLANICRMSGVSAVIHADSLPLSGSLRRFCRRAAPEVAYQYTGISDLPLELSFMLSAGEDFELLWTVPPEREKESVARVAETLGRAPFRIGEIRQGTGVFLEYGGREIDISRRGYEH
jgi:thiamine-monophosphate kinase